MSGQIGLVLLNRHIKTDAWNDLRVLLSQISDGKAYSSRQTPQRELERGRNLQAGCWHRDSGVCAVFGRFDPLQNRLDSLIQPSRSLSRVMAQGAPLKKLDPEVLLELADVFAKRRRRHACVCGRLCMVSILASENKVRKLLGFQLSSSPP
ncbi:hypothetical protein ASD03_09825 [Ensifer sp. Root127]|nr:hypothetical protein ASD03_09825 [Ensifer sp. Root127]